MSTPYWRLATRWLLTAPVVAAIACSSSFDPTDPRGAMLRVDVHQDSAGVVQVQATLDPGRTKDRGKRLVVSPLLVQGVSFPFDASAYPPSVDQRRVAGALPVRLDAGREPLGMTLPRVDGLTAPIAALAFSTVRSASSDTLTLLSDGSFTLSLVMAQGHAPVLSRRWSLELVGARPVAIGGEGLPPARLTIPADLVPSRHTDGTWYALLNFTERLGVTPLPGRNLGRSEYSVEAAWIQRLLLPLRPAR